MKSQFALLFTLLLSGLHSSPISSSSSSSSEYETYTNAPSMEDRQLPPIDPPVEEEEEYDYINPGEDNFPRSSSCNIVQGMDQFCPLTVPPAHLNFSSSEERTVLTSSTTSCCKNQFLPCQLQQGVAYSRALFTYTMPGGGTSGSNVQQLFMSGDGSPVLPAECNCQTALATEQLLLLQFCPNVKNCCQDCGCHGDPHCTSFAQVPETWAICDDRDETCTHTPNTCAQTTYANKPCVWLLGRCVRNNATEIPQMIMYEKRYKSYFNISNTEEHLFKIQLTLIHYGVIGTVLIQDYGLEYVFQSVGCTSPFPLNNRGQVVLDNLPSGVKLLLTCTSPGGVVGNERWDVNELTDPWYTPLPHIAEESFSGFCATNHIGENAAPPTKTCKVVDRQVAHYFGCPYTKSVQECRVKFCLMNVAKKLRINGISPNALMCQNYIKQENRWLWSACALVHLASRDPEQCLSDRTCSQCVDDVSDFPDEIDRLLGKQNHQVPTVPTLAPTAPCPENLLSTGLSRRRLFSESSGIQIDAWTGLLWRPVFALLDSEISACGGCDNILSVNGSDPSNFVLMQPGTTYRVQQITGLDRDPKQELCQSAPGYNATATLLNANSGGGISRAYGDMYEEGDLVCSATKYKRCPLNYQCCIWNRQTQAGAWQDCMRKYPGGGNAYPNCQAE